MIKQGAKNVVLFDFQEPYSQGLASAAEAVLKAKGVTTTRQSVANTVTDFSSFVTKVPSRRRLRLLPDAEAGRRAELRAAAARAGQEGEGVRRRRLERRLGSSRSPGSYVSNFAPDISGFAYNKSIIAGWQKDNPKDELGSFGPPTYLATQVALNAIKKACDAGKGQIKDRRDVVRNVKKIVVKNSILGGDFRFSTKSNDPLNGKFYIFQIQSNGSYKLVG